MIDGIKERLNFDYVKREIVRTAYGNRDTLIARLDPRVLIIWYLVYAILPWFFYNRTILIGIVVMLAIFALATRVSYLIIFMIGFGIIGDIIGWMVASFFFGGDLTVFWSLTTLILKLLAVSLASVAIFASLEPERLSDGLLSLGMPDQFSFGMSYGYRIIPVLLEEYQNVIYACRLRGKAPDRPGPFYLRGIIYWAGLLIKAFYPMLLNMAKRTRTTVEGLEIKGYTYSTSNPEVRALKLSYLKVQRADILFVLISFIITALIIQIGRLYPL